MEWSWKFRGWTAVGNRVFWLGGSRRRMITRESLVWLLQHLGQNAGPADDWCALLDRRLDRALVAYSGPDPFTGRSAAIKVYLTLDRCTPSLYRRHVRPLAAGLPERPPRAGTVLLCRTIDARGMSGARAYALFNDTDLRRRTVWRFLEATIGRRGLAAAVGYPRVGVGLKTDGTDMLGIGLRPTERRRLTVAQLWRPVMLPLVNAAVRTPLLAERLNEVTWVTVPLDARSLSFPRQLDEMNVYVQLRPGNA
jgi:hypothetical protein